MSMEWNRNLYERIRAAADRGAVHHALLLTGPKGSGKGELARFIAGYGVSGPAGAALRRVPGLPEGI